MEIEGLSVIFSHTQTCFGDEESRTREVEGLAQSDALCKVMDL